MEKPFQIEKLIDYLESTAEEYPIIGIAYLYGSYISGAFHKKSDIDIALVLKNFLEKRQLLKIEMTLAAKLDKEFKCCFDVRSINRAPLRVKGEIITKGKLIYCSDEDFRISFETFIRTRYFDFLPALCSMRKVYFNSIKTGGLIGPT